MDALDFSAFNYIDVIGVLPVEIVVTYVLAKMLDMKHEALFWVIRLSIIVLVSGYREQLDPIVRTVIGIGFLQLVLPLLFWRGPFLRRLFAAVLVLVAVTVSELAAAVLWEGITGSSISTSTNLESNMTEFLLVRILHLFICVVLAVGALLLFRRMTIEKHDRGAMVFIALPATQIILLSICIALIQYTHSQTYYFGLAVFLLAVVCLLVDVGLFFSFNRYRKRCVAEQRANMVKKQLDDYLLEYGKTVEGIEAIARLRHDLRNELLIVTALFESGKTEEARHFLREVIVRCEEFPLASQVSEEK